MKFVEYNDIAKERWDQFVASSPDAWLYHTSGYIDYRVAEGEQNVSFAVFSDTEELLAICVLYDGRERINRAYSRNIVVRTIQRIINKSLRLIKIRPEALWLKKIFCSDSFGGPALAAHLKNKGRRKMWNAIFAHIDEIAKSRNIDRLEVRLPDLAPQYLPPLRKDHNPLWQVGVYDYLCLPPRLVLILDLSKSEEELRRDMDEDCRSEINRAVKNGVTLCLDSDSVGDYHKIHKISWERTVGYYQSLKHFEDMLRFLGVEKIKLLFAEYNGNKVSGVLLHCYKDAIFYWGGCSLEEGLKVRANNYLLWSAVLWAKSRDYKWFEIGLFQPCPGESLKEYSVGQYKAQFSNNYYPALEGKKEYRKK